METLKNRIVKLLGTLNERVYGKEEVMALALLSAVAGESIFLLGPPGVAKSMVARRLKLMFRGGTAFEYLMSRFSTPDEIFGPVSIARLKNEDTYERMTEGYLPTATVVFLDEIWKAGPAIQNALLTVINEKIFRNGQFSVRVPMKGLIAASNELPASGQGLEALYDRFLVRKLVGGIEDLSDFDRMISTADESEPEVDESLAVSDEEYRQWQEQMKSVGLHYSVLEVIHSLKDKLEDYNRQHGVMLKVFFHPRPASLTKLLQIGCFQVFQTDIPRSLSGMHVSFPPTRSDSGTGLSTVRPVSGSWLLSLFSRQTGGLRSSRLLLSPSRRNGLLHG
jgi:MoxR-like ATPase